MCFCFAPSLTGQNNVSLVLRLKTKPLEVSSGVLCLTLYRYFIVFMSCMNPKSTSICFCPANSILIPNAHSFLSCFLTPFFPPIFPVILYFQPFCCLVSFLVKCLVLLSCTVLDLDLQTLNISVPL